MLPCLVLGLDSCLVVGPHGSLYLLYFLELKNPNFVLGFLAFYVGIMWKMKFPMSDLDLMMLVGSPINQNCKDVDSLATPSPAKDSSSTCCLSTLLFTRDSSWADISSDVWVSDQLLEMKEE